VVAFNGLTAPSCGGGPSTSPGTMTGNELTLANLIATHRYALGLPSDPINVGVAQWHARDMAENGYVGFIGSDGEDPNRRIVCSGGSANTIVGVIAVGYSTDPN